MTGRWWGLHPGPFLNEGMAVLDVDGDATTAMLLLAGCATADLSVDSAAHVSGTINVVVSKDSLTTANEATVEDFQKIIETRLASAPGAGRLFENAVYTTNDSGLNVTTTYSKATFDDSANTYARVLGSRRLLNGHLDLRPRPAGDPRSAALARRHR